MAGYTKDFLMQAYFSRYESVITKMPAERATKYRKMCNDFYDEVGKDKFRVYASLDADAIKKFKGIKNLNLRDQSN